MDFCVSTPYFNMHMCIYTANKKFLPLVFVLFDDIHKTTHMEGFCLPIFCSDFRFSDGCEIGPAHCQWSPATANRKSWW